MAEEALAIVKIGVGVLMIDATESAKATTTVSEVGPTMIPTPAQAEAEVVVADVVAAAVVAVMAVEAVMVVAEAADVAAEESLDSIETIDLLKGQVEAEDVVAIINVHLAIITTKIDYF